MRRDNRSAAICFELILQRIRSWTERASKPLAFLILNLAILEPVKAEIIPESTGQGLFFRYAVDSGVPPGKEAEAIDNVGIGIFDPEGAGVAVTDLNGNNKPDLILMSLINHNQAGGVDTSKSSVVDSPFFVKSKKTFDIQVLHDFDGKNFSYLSPKFRNEQSAEIADKDPLYVPRAPNAPQSHFGGEPTVDHEYPSHFFQAPGHQANGAGLAVGQLDNDKAGRPDLVMMMIEDKPGNNEFKYRVAWNLDEWAIPADVSKVITIGPLSRSAEGGGIEIAQIDANPRPDLVLVAYNTGDGDTSLLGRTLADLYRSGKNQRKPKWQRSKPSEHEKPNHFQVRLAMNINRKTAEPETVSPLTVNRRVTGMSNYFADGMGVASKQLDADPGPDLLLMAHSYRKVAASGPNFSSIVPNETPWSFKAILNLNTEARYAKLTGKGSAIRPPATVIANPGFKAGYNWPDYADASGIAFGDVDNDGYDEVGIIRKTHKSFRWKILEDGRETEDHAPYEVLGSGGHQWGASYYANSIAFGDVDNDGYDEFGITRAPHNGNLGDDFRWKIRDDARKSQDREAFATLKQGGHNWGDPFFATDIAFGDVDGDGFDEFGICRKNSDGNLGNNFAWKIRDDARESDNSETFATIKQGGHRWGDWIYASCIAFGDVDGDGLDEVGIGRYAGGQNFRWKVRDDAKAKFRKLEGSEKGMNWGMAKNQKGLFKKNKSVPVFTNDLDFGDVDNDGLDELGIARVASGGDFRWEIRDDAKKQPPFESMIQGGQSWGDDHNATSIAFGDIDNDGYDEIAIGRQAVSNHRYIVRNDANEYFGRLHEGGVNWGRENYANSVAIGNTRGGDELELGVTRKAADYHRYQVYGLTSAPGLSWPLSQSQRSSHSPIWMHGQPVWRYKANRNTRSGGAGLAVADLDGDGNEDIVMLKHALESFDGDMRNYRSVYHLRVVTNTGFKTGRQHLAPGDGGDSKGSSNEKGEQQTFFGYVKVLQSGNKDNYPGSCALIRLRDDENQDFILSYTEDVLIERILREASSSGNLVQLQAVSTAIRPEQADYDEFTIQHIHHYNRQ